MNIRTVPEGGGIFSGERMKSEGGWKYLAGILLGSVVGAPVDEVLKALLREVHDDLSRLDAKLDRLLNSPFVTAERHLELAREYPYQSDQFKKEVEHAKNLFSQAASNLENAAAVKALISCGVCCALLEDKRGAKFFESKAIKAVRHDYKKLEAAQQSRKTNILAGVSVTSGVVSFGTGAIGALLLFTAPPVGLGMLAASAGLGATAVATGKRAFGDIEILELRELGKMVDRNNGNALFYVDKEPRSHEHFHLPSH